MKHGLYKLESRLRLKGWDAIDWRTRGAKQLSAWRSELTASLGGEDNITPQRKAILEAVCRSRLFLESIDLWLLEQPSLILKRKRSLLPALVQRQALCDSLMRQLQAIGLERVPAPIPSLQDYLRQRELEMAVQDASGGDSRDVEGQGSTIALPEGQA
jgi:hypothetical protein